MTQHEENVNTVYRYLAATLSTGPTDRPATLQTVSRTLRTTEGISQEAIADALLEAIKWGILSPEEEAQL